MKNKIFFREGKKGGEFRAFKAKMLVRTIWLMLFAVFFIYWLYAFVLAGNFANWTVAAFQRLFGLDDIAALTLYQQTFRNHSGFIILLAVMLVFFVIFRIYLNWFTKYFREIDRGMDALAAGEGSDVSLSPELIPLERKMNAVKRALEKQKRDMLAEEQKKNDLVMYLAHDLKTPLASVTGYLNLLHDEKEISEELREKYLAVSLEKARRLEDLIFEFFEIAKFSLSHIELSYGRVSLFRLLEMVRYEFKPMLEERRLGCVLNVKEDVMLCCDADKIQRVFDNLLKNAVAYSYAGTDIDILVKKREGSVWIRFRNHGDTIPPEKLERIFERFYRPDFARSTRSGGAGLGLAIARQIVELHRGTITARSADGVIIFEILLPLDGPGE